MQQLRPKETVPVVRHLDDPVDTNAYYIQAIVRDSLSGSVIETINLEKQTGSQRYTGRFTAPSEGSSGRKYVDVTTKVYSDSGYTTQDSQYGDENVQYIVAVDWSPTGPAQFGGFGGGPDIDYKRIKKIVDERIDQVEKKIPTKEIKDLNKKVTGMERVFETIISPELEKAGVNIESLYDKADSFDVLEKKLGEVLKAIKAIDIPKPEKVDLAPILSAVGGLKTYINKLPSELPQPQEIDINVVVDAINDLADIVGEMQAEVDKTLSKGVSDLEKKVVNRDITGIKKNMHSKMAKMLKSMSDDDIMSKDGDEKEDKNEAIINKLLA